MPSPLTPVLIGSPVAFARVIVGPLANTALPVPVGSVTAECKLEELGVARNVATFVPSPLTPVLIGSPVAFARVIVGPLANTALPVPVGSVTAECKLEELGVARNVATFVPSPLTPVLIGRFVPCSKFTATGMPRFGVVNVGELETTKSRPVPFIVPML